MTLATAVYNKHHRNAPAGAVYIGRGSPYGNPFVIGRDGDRDEVCNKFECEVLPSLDVTALRGKSLVCYCKPARCHGDAILRKANHV
jgi:hypothetical protein